VRWLASLKGPSRRWSISPRPAPQSLRTHPPANPTTCPLVGWFCTLPLPLLPIDGGFYALLLPLVLPIRSMPPLRLPLADQHPAGCHPPLINLASTHPPPHPHESSFSLPASKTNRSQPGSVVLACTHSTPPQPSTLTAFTHVAAARRSTA